MATQPGLRQRHHREYTRAAHKLMARLFIAILVLATAANAQQNRIDPAVDIGQRHTLTGHLHPKARPENDQGPVLPSRTFSYVTLGLEHSERQQTELDQLLAQ